MEHTWASEFLIPWFADAAADPSVTAASTHVCAHFLQPRLDPLRHPDLLLAPLPLTMASL